MKDLISNKWRRVSSCYLDSLFPHAVWKENYCTKIKYICMKRKLLYQTQVYMYISCTNYCTRKKLMYQI